MSVAPGDAGRRVAAGALDGLLLGGGLALILATELALASPDQSELFAYGWFVLFAPLYFALYHAYGTGATPGQLELRIGLRDARTGERPSLPRALARSYLGFLFLVLVVPALADLLATTTGRSLRDRITRTTAVDIALAGKAPELAGATVPELAANFEPPAGTRRYLQRGWALLRARPRLVLGTVAAVYTVLVAIAAILAFLLVADWPDPWTIVAYVSLLLVLLGSGVYWAQAALVMAVEEIRVGGADASVWATLGRALRRVNALSAALAALLLLAALAPYTLLLSLVVAGRLVLVAPALVLEDTRVLGGFRRSWQLTRGQTGRLFGLLLLSGLLLMAAAWAATLAAGIVSALGGGPVADGLGIGLGMAAFVVVLAWLGASWSLVYEDARRALPPGSVR